MNLFLAVEFGSAHALLFRLHMVHTSDKIQGQVYIPIANWLRESRSVQNRQSLKLVSSYDSNYCYSRCFQQLH
jgi:K+ transporter